MTIVTLRLPDELHQQTTQLARDRGESLDKLVREILQEYLEDLEDAKDVAEFERQRAAGSVELLDWAEVNAALDADPNDG